MNQQRRLTRRQPKALKVNKCADCNNSIFDEQWGEHKCKARGIRIYNQAAYCTCKLFKKKTEKK